MPPLDWPDSGAYALVMADEPQNDTASAGSHTTLFSWLAWALLILLVLYPLSVGPVAKIIGPTPNPTVRAFYAPLGYLHDHSQAVRSFYDWYGHLWGVRL